MDRGQRSKGAGPSQNDHDAIIRAALQANLRKTLHVPISVFKAKQAQWDKNDIAANKKFERRERQVENSLAIRATPKPSLMIPIGEDDENGSDDDGRADSPEYDSDGAEGTSADNHTQDEMVAEEYDEPATNNDKNSNLNPQELAEVPNDASGFCDDVNNIAVFDMFIFKAELSKCRAKFAEQEEMKESNEDILKKEFDSLSKCVLIDADVRESFPGCPEWIRKEQFENAFVAAIIDSDYELFFELYANEMERDGKCSERCLCKMIVSPYKARMTPLHLAAAVSNAEFLKRTVSDEDEFVAARREKITKLLEHRSERVDRWKSVDHYEYIMETWSESRSGFDMTPLCMTAEDGRVHEYSAIHRRITNEIIYQDSSSRREKDKYDHIDPLICFHVPSTLSRLVHQKNFLHEYRKNGSIVLDCVFEPLNIHKKRYAISLAACNGDMETLNFFQRLSEDNLCVFEQRTYDYEGDEALVVPGKILIDGSSTIYPTERSPVVHELVEYGHFDAFNGLEVEQKLVRDYYSFTALVSMLNFSDEQVKSQLKIFEKAEREDLFLFVAQVIVKNRRGLLKDALQLALVNPDNFDVRSKCSDVYEDYGLPDYVPLPMETALSRNGDMISVEMIAEFYQKYMDKHRRKMINEDALRCIESIQDRACRCSDQIRLAVICMMFPFVSPSSERFKKVMKMHLDRRENDDVSKYVLGNLSAKTYKFEKWNVVFEKAGIEVKKWNGSVESEKVLSNINPQRNKGLGKNTRFFPIRKTPQEHRFSKTGNAKKPRSIDRAMNTLVEAFRKMPLS